MNIAISKLVLPLVVLILSSFVSFSQYVEGVMITKDDLSSFKDSPLYVVQGILTQEYDEQIKKAIEENWTFTEYEFIDTSSFNELYTSASNFFLIPDQHQYQRKRDHLIVEEHSFVKLKILKGNGGANGDTRHGEMYPPVGIASILYLLDDSFRFKNFKYLDDSKEIKREKITADSAASWNNQIDTLQKYGFQLDRKMNGVNEIILPVLVKNLQLQCTELITDEYINGEARKKKMNESNGKIREAPLYILDLDLNDKITSLSDIKKYYDGEVYVVSAIEYIELIKKNKDVNIVNCVHDIEQNYVRVFNVKSGEIIYLVRSVIHEKYPAGVIKYHIKKW